ncbi:MAG: TauD/TfdA family dioxygenase [Alphaproteobacteria bacterium]|nr:TauD/TfdA family dioxygenase [Alphaproteobacteria bacterium]
MMAGDIDRPEAETIGAASRGRVPARPLEPVVDPAGWTKEDLAASDDWVHELTEAEIADLDRAVAEIGRRGLALMDIAKEDFSLPVLGPALEAIARDVIDGRGFVLIRGVPVDRYARLEAAIAFWCIGRYLGEPVSQNAKGHVLGHVKDLGDTSFDNPQHRGYQTPDQLPYHSDSCDVVGLLCLHPARSGGESTIVSSITIHNEMLRRRPDLVAALAEPIYRDRRGEIPEGAEPWFQLPVFNYHQGYLTTSWQGGYIRSAGRFTELPAQSPKLLEALDMFDRLARELCFAMDFRPGDIQFLHNHVVVHSRTAFVDYPEPEKKRHLLRLWLSTPDGRPLPAGFAARYHSLKPGARPAGGIIVAGTRLQAPLEAE